MVAAYDHLCRWEGAYMSFPVGNKILLTGICRYSPREGHCSIGMSTPLLKLRPRKDMVETLLHEMIHAYLFVTQVPIQFPFFLFKIIYIMTPRTTETGMDMDLNSTSTCIGSTPLLELQYLSITLFTTRWHCTNSTGGDATVHAPRSLPSTAL